MPAGSGAKATGTGGAGKAARFRVAREQRHRLDVAGVRKHVHHPDALQPVAVVVDQDAGIAGQGGGMTAHVEHPLRPLPTDQRHHGLGAGARGVQQHAVEVCALPGGVGAGQEQVGDVKVDGRLAYETSNMRVVLAKDEDA